MITIVDALGFRCLQDVAQTVDDFQVLVGPNGSGKTTFLEVLTFLGTLLKDGLENAVSGRSEDPRDLTWRRQGDRFDIGVVAEIPSELRSKLTNPAHTHVRYEVSIVVEPALSIARELLYLRSTPDEPMPSPLAPRTVFATKPAKARRIVQRDEDGSTKFSPETDAGKARNWLLDFNLGTKRCALDNLPEDEIAFPVSTWLKATLKEGIQTVMLNSLHLRRPSPPLRKGSAAVLSNDGSNLPWVVAELEGSGERFQEWVRHVQTAIPDLAGIRTATREEDRTRYLLLRYESGIEIPSWLASDGTLRLLALTLPAYLAPRGGVYLIEEPENGIHPQAVETVFQSLHSVYGAQVFLATHSPVILNLAQANELLCFRKGLSGGTEIVRGSVHPALKGWKGETTLGALLASGVLG